MDIGHRAARADGSVHTDSGGVAAVARVEGPLSPGARGWASTAIRDRTVLLLVAVIALGAVLRFSTLGEQSFWFDEGFTWRIVSRNLAYVFTRVPQTESTPPLYYVVAWFWTRLFGIREVGLRSLSALCGTLTIPVVWAIGRRLVSNRTGLIAALLTAVNPLLFWYSQEARTYALLVLLCSLTLLALVYALESPTRGRMLTWGVLAALALCAHYFAAFLLAIEAAWLLYALRSKRLLTLDRVTLSLGPLVLMAAALTPLLKRQDDGRAGFIANASGSIPYRIVQFAKQDIVGDGQPHEVLLGSIGFLCVIAAVILLVARANRRQRDGALFALGIGLGAILLAVVISAVGTDYMDSRNLLPTWPALCVGIAAGFSVEGSRRIAMPALAVLTVLSLFCISNVIRDPIYQRDNWRGAVQAIGPATAPRALVSDVSSLITLRPYVPGITGYPTRGLKLREVDMLWVARSYGKPLGHSRPVPLPGFSMTETRTTSYEVLRYRSPRPVLEPRATLVGLFPSRALGYVQLQP